MSVPVAAPAPVNPSPPSSKIQPAAKGRASGLTFRALLLGLIFTALTDLWIHWAELILGGRGHTALGSTSIPVGAFNVLFLLTIVNLFITRFLKPLAFTAAERLVIYVMMTVSTVISSSGGIHFVVPTVAAAFYYADNSNGWAGKFHQYIPDWIAQKNADALKGFYIGNASVPWADWRMQIASWTVFLSLFAIASLCLVSLLRRQWVDRERLTFPTVALPTELIARPENLLSNRLMWFGFAIPFALDIINTIHLNYPSVPLFPTRADGQFDIGQALTSPPWNAIGRTPLSFYPFVIGIAYLLSTEMTFSCWFFWIVTKVEAVYGSAAGFNEGGGSGTQSQWPFIGQQGAGAFLALSVFGLWLSRGYLKEIWTIAFAKQTGADKDEPLSYRMAFIGLGISALLLIGWCMAAGMRGPVAIVLIVLSLLYTLAATRIRAETGNAWLFGPTADVHRLMTATFGTAVYHPADLTALAYVRNIIASSELRCLTMPNQLDAYKMADGIGVNKRRLTFALLLAIVLGVAVSFAIGLMIWYGYGANAKTDSWRTYMGRMPFDSLSDTLGSPVKPDITGTIATGGGFLITVSLMLLRIRFLWWPFHPVGYAMANTNTMNQLWLPFFLAWLFKTLVLRYGGLKLYRLSLPFCYGVIMGDFIAGGLTTAVGCFTGINAYPINW